MPVAAPLLELYELPLGSVSDLGLTLLEVTVADEVTQALTRPRTWCGKQMARWARRGRHGGSDCNPSVDESGSEGVPRGAGR